MLEHDPAAMPLRHYEAEGGAAPPGAVLVAPARLDAFHLPKDSGPFVRVGSPEAAGLRLRPPPRNPRHLVVRSDEVEIPGLLPPVRWRQEWRAGRLCVDPHPRRAAIDVGTLAASLMPGVLPDGWAPPWTASVLAYHIPPCNPLVQGDALEPKLRGLEAFARAHAGQRRLPLMLLRLTGDHARGEDGGGYRGHFEALVAAFATRTADDRAALREASGRVLGEPGGAAAARGLRSAVGR